jgi:hypothetical protein
LSNGPHLHDGRAARLDQQEQVLQVQGLQRQPPFVQLQVQAVGFFSVFSIV